MQKPIRKLVKTRSPRRSSGVTLYQTETQWPSQETMGAPGDTIVYTGMVDGGFYPQATPTGSSSSSSGGSIVGALVGAVTDAWNGATEVIGAAGGWVAEHSGSETSGSAGARPSDYYAH